MYIELRKGNNKMKTRYLVYYSEYRVGSCVDETTKVFKNKDKAKQCCKKLNKELAESNHCKVKDLGGRYYSIKIEYIK